MTRNLIQFEREACNLCESRDGRPHALNASTVAVQVRASEAILLAGKLADELADAIEAGG